MKHFNVVEKPKEEKKPEVQAAEATRAAV